MTTLPQPIGRLVFLGRFVIAIIAFEVLNEFFIWVMFSSTRHGEEQVSLVFFTFAVWVILLLFLAMCFIRFAIIARLASIGLNRWFALLLLIPVVNFFFILFLLFKPALKPPEQIVEPAPM